MPLPVTLQFSGPRSATIPTKLGNLLEYASKMTTFTQRSPRTNIFLCLPGCEAWILKCSTKWYRSGWRVWTWTLFSISTAKNFLVEWRGDFLSPCQQLVDAHWSFWMNLRQVLQLCTLLIFGDFRAAFGLNIFFYPHNRDGSGEQKICVEAHWHDQKST